jgi:hypothetical protein
MDNSRGDNSNRRLGLNQQMGELRALLVATTADEADQTQLARLSELLENRSLSAEAAALLEQQSAMTDALSMGEMQRGTASSGAAQVGHLSLAKRSSAATAIDRRSGWLQFTALALCLLLTHAIFAYVGWQQAKVAVKSDDSPPVVVTQTAGPQLVAMTGCVWEASTAGSPAVGQSLRQGEVLTLMEGIAELELGDLKREQVRVRIEGPASIFVRADGKLGMRYGSLTADLADLVNPFTFDLPLGRVVVSNLASVGMTAGTSTNEVHVFSGQVAIDSERVAAEWPLATVREGEAVRLRADETNTLALETLSASRDHFPSARSMAFDRLNLGEAYRRAVLASQPELYWSFDPQGDQILNQGAAVDMHGRLDGEVSWPRYESNHTVEFGLNPLPGAIMSEGLWPNRVLADYTIEFWAKPSHSHNGVAISLVGPPAADGRYPHGAMVEFGGPFQTNQPHNCPRNGLRFLHRNPVTTNVLVGVSCKAAMVYSVREWQHVVARKQGQNMRLYVDGQKVATAEDPSQLQPGLRLLVGQMYPIEGTKQLSHAWLRPFIGQIDEVALYDRAISESEIRKHFDAGRSTDRFSDSI